MVFFGKNQIPYLENRQVQKEKIWKHVILGKAISVRGNAKNGNVCSETASDSLAIKQEPMIGSSWNKRQKASNE